MKRILWNITFASLLTLVAYIALYAMWGAILSGFQNPTLKLFLIALMTVLAFGSLFLYISKIRKSVGEDEVIADYRDRKYTSIVDDFKLIMKRESKTLLCIVGIVLICYALNRFDQLVFEKKIISFPTFFFTPLCLFGSLFKNAFIGYALSAFFDSAVYIIFLLFFRKKKYDYWMKKKT